MLQLSVPDAADLASGVDGDVREAEEHVPLPPGILQMPHMPLLDDHCSLQQAVQAMDHLREGYDRRRRHLNRPMCTGHDTFASKV